MGCQVVSVYNDEVAGAIGYPEPILNDLMRRDYATANLLKQVPNKHNYFVYGFTQSFAESSMYSYVLGGKQFLVFSSGRFLVVTSCSDWSQRAIMHENKIMCLDAKDKLCVTGTIGGRIILWDLEFFEQKVNIQMPTSSINFSSISLSGKHIFCTDSMLPNNNVYCYDIRTTKMKACGALGSFQPTLKGVSWGSNVHVTVAADGVWFSCYRDVEGKKLQITKGMFRIFPKTSMTCVAVVDETYVISGSVDGYVFLWAHLQCQKAIKVADCAISEMALYKKNLIVSNFNENVRVFSYKISQKKNMEEDQRINGEITEDFVTIVLDSYERPPLQAVVVSKLDQSIYYAQTRSGVLYNKMIPSPEYFNKLSVYSQVNKEFVQFQRDSVKLLHNNTLWCVKVNRPFFQITEMPLEDNSSMAKWKVRNKYISNAKGYVKTDKILFGLIPQLQKIYYVGQKQIKLVQLARIDANSDIKLSSLQEQLLLSYVSEGKQSVQVIGLTHFCLKGQHYIMVFFDKDYLLMKKEEENWVEKLSKDYEQQITKSIQIDGSIIEFEQANDRYRAKITQCSSEKLFKMSFMHCVQDIQAVSLAQGKTVSIGGDSILIATDI